MSWELKHKKKKKRKKIDDFLKHFNNSKFFSLFIKNKKMEIFKKKWMENLLFSSNKRRRSRKETLLLCFVRMSLVSGSFKGIFRDFSNFLWFFIYFFAKFVTILKNQAHFCWNLGEYFRKNGDFSVFSHLSPSSDFWKVFLTWKCVSRRS